MKKKLLSALAALTLCSGSVFAYDLAWVGEDKAESNFYFYNSGSNLWIGDKNDVPTTFIDVKSAILFTIKDKSFYYGDTNHYVRNNSGTSSFSAPYKVFLVTTTPSHTWDGDKNGWILSDKSSIETDDTRFMVAGGDGVQLQFPKKSSRGETYNKWLLISPKQMENHNPLQTLKTNQEAITLADYESINDNEREDDEYDVLKLALDADFDVCTANVSDINNAITALATAKSSADAALAELQKGPALEALAGNVEAAKALKSSAMNAGVLSALNTAISTAEGMTMSNSGVEIAGAASGLADAVADAEASVAAYSTFNTLVGTIAGQVAYFDAAGRAAYDNSAALASYNDGSMTDGVAETAALYAALRTAAKAQTTNGADMTLAINNPSFELGISGWNINDAGVLKTVIPADEVNGNAEAVTGANGVKTIAFSNNSQADMGFNQTVENLHAGVYTLTVGVAGNTNTGDPHKLKFVFDDQSVVFTPSSNNSLTDISLTIVLASDKDVNIQLGYNEVKSGSGFWFKADNFRLTQALNADTYNSLVDVNENNVYLVNGGNAIARGANYGTRAVMDNNGLALNIVTAGDKKATATFSDTSKKMFVTADGYVYTDYNNNGSTDFYMMAVSGGYKILLANEPAKALGITIDGDNSVIMPVDVASATVWTLESDKANLTVKEGKYGTFVAPYDVELPAGVNAYTISAIEGNNVVLSDAVTGTLTANTPVLVDGGTAGTTYYYGDAADGVADGAYLHGFLTAGTVPVDSYVLQDKGEGQKFYKVADTFNGTKNRCYLTVPASSVKVMNLVFGGQTTAVESVDAAISSDKQIYDLSGRRVNKAQKGLYIVNGKKVLY